MADVSTTARIGQIVDVTDICRSFPQLAEPQINRDNVIQLVDTILDSDLQLLTIEGAEGIGKSTLLAQFAKQHGRSSHNFPVKARSVQHPPFLHATASSLLAELTGRSA